MPRLFVHSVLGFVLLVVSCSSWGSTLRADEAEPAAKQDEYYQMMKIFVDTFDEIERNYVKEVDRQELLDAAIRGMLSELDQHSNYIGPEDFTRFNQTVEQEFGGIGIQVTRDLTVMTPLPGSPAYKAGIRAGDRIIEIDGQPTSEFPNGRQLEKAVELLKGEPGSKVTIGVKHLDSDEIVQVPIERDIIHLQTVLGDHYGEGDQWDFMLDDDKKIGYIRLSHFSRHSAEEMTAALKKLTEKGMRGLILDLRYNPGGLLSQAAEIADLFLEEGKIVSTKGRNTEEREWTAKREGTFSGFPMAVIINGSSASASEIVSAALQDHERAVVVGERSYGKGSVQNVIELGDHQRALKLTTASYFRPSGKNIHRFENAKEEDEWGVIPNEDYRVKVSIPEQIEYQKYRQARDILQEDAPADNDFEDKQLNKALEYVLAELGEKPEPAKTNATAEKKSEKKADAEKKAAEKSADEADAKDKADAKKDADKDAPKNDASTKDNPDGNDSSSKKDDNEASLKLPRSGQDGPKRTQAA